MKDYLITAEEAVEALLRRYGDEEDEEGPLREGLKDTPRRVAEAFEFWTSGYEQDPADILKMFEDGHEGYDAMVFQRDIPVWSLCEHHLAPFFGVAHIGYIPWQRIVGLSKLARLTDVFARRFQVQERLTVQIADALVEHLNPHAVGVVLECRHTCMESRGVCKAGTVTVTSAIRGVFREDPSAASEFFSFVRSK